MPSADFLPWTSNLAIKKSLCQREDVRQMYQKGKCMGWVWSVYRNHCFCPLNIQMYNIVISSLQSSLCRPPVACLTDWILNACHEVSKLVSLGLLARNRSTTWPRDSCPTSIGDTSKMSQTPHLHNVTQLLHKSKFLLRHIKQMYIHYLIIFCTDYASTSC